MTHLELIQNLLAEKGEVVCQASVGSNRRDSDTTQTLGQFHRRADATTQWENAATGDVKAGIQE
jgi:hypothetical protein